MIISALDSIQEQSDKVVATIVAELFAELTRVTPVGTPESTGKKGYIGGSLKASWELEEKVGGWVISNNMEYASIIFEGRRLVAGKMYGSEQLPAGIDPILMKYNKLLEQRLNNIKE